MIVEWLLTALVASLEALTWLLPDVSLDGFDDELDGFASLIGGGLGSLDGVLPITESLIVLGWVITSWLPAVLAFKVGEWLWSHLPFL